MLKKSLRLFSRSSFRCAQIRFQSSYGSNPSSSFFSPPRSPAPPAQHVELSGVEFSKPDGSLQVRFRPPKFAPARAPPIGGAQLYRPAVEGIITLRLTPASSVANTSDGRVSYDWDASLQINLGVLEILHVVQNSIAASVNVQEAPPRGGGGGGGQQQQQQQQQRMRLEILPPTSVAAAPTAGSSSASNNNVTQGGGPNLYRISILSEEGKGVSVSVSQAEVYLLRNLLGTSLPWVTGWMYNLDPSALIPGYHLLPPYQPSPVVNQSQQPSTQQQATGYASHPQPSQSQQPRSPGTAAPSSSPYGGGRPYSPPPSSRSSSSPPQQQQQQQQSSSSSSYSRPPYPPRNT